MAFVFNSNSIEGSTLTPKEIELLLKENIAPNRPLEDVLEAKNAEKTLNFVKESNEELTEKFLLKVHEMYFKETKPYVAGKYKTAQNRITGSAFETTPPKFVLTDMKLYFQEYEKLKKELHPLELAAWAHWKLVRIHPFQDGNGRTRGRKRTHKTEEGETRQHNQRRYLRLWREIRNILEHKGA